MNILFLMDPLEKIQPKKDTTIAFMRGAKRKGHRTFYLPPGGITLDRGQFYFYVTEVVVEEADTLPAFQTKPSCTLCSEEVDVIFIRTDPPFGNRYLMDTWLLDRLPKHIFICNNPSGVRTVNEKIWVTQFLQWTPPTLISCQKERLLEFVDHFTTCIAKPTDGFGGSGVFKLTKTDSNLGVILDTLSDRFSKEIILQPFIPEADLGDKRILLLNGKPLGAVLRIHGDHDHRNNFFAGGSAQPAIITPHEEAMIAELSPHLLRLGLYFVGIDIIGTHLIEINVTSPTCIQEMNKFGNVHLEDQVINFVENHSIKKS